MDLKNVNVLVNQNKSHLYSFPIKIPLFLQAALFLSTIKAARIF